MAAENAALTEEASGWGQSAGMVEHSMKKQ